MRRLGELCELINGRGFKKSEWGEAGLKIVRIQNLNGSPEYNYTAVPVGERNRVRTGELLYAWSATIGPYIWRAEEAALNQHIFKVIPTADIDKNYLYYLLLEATRELRHVMHGSTMTHILKSQLERLKVNLPSVTEQRRIVAEIEKQFTRLDAAVRTLRRLQAKLNGYTGALLHAVVSREASHVVPLGELLSEPLRNGHSAKPSHNGKGIRAITLTAITTGDFSEVNTKITSADPERVRDLWLSPGDFLFQRGNTAELVGLARLYRGPARFAIFPDLVIRARVNETVNWDYLELVLHADKTRAYLRSKSQGSAGSMPKIDQQAIESTPIPLPCRKEQDAVSERICAARTDLRRTSAEVELSIKHAGRLRHATLAKAFSGQLVPQDPNDEPASVLLERIRAGRERLVAGPVNSRRTRSRTPAVALQSE